MQRLGKLLYIGTLGKLGSPHVFCALANQFPLSLHFISTNITDNATPLFTASVAENVKDNKWNKSRQNKTDLGSNNLISRGCFSEKKINLFLSLHEKA